MALRSNRLKNYPTLRRAIASSRPKGVSKTDADRAKTVLISWVDTAERHAVPFGDALERIRDGAAARQIAEAAAEAQIAAGQGIVKEAACAAGCAFCCILQGEDGGTIGADEARRLHEALLPLVGQPDGRAWHLQACASLDPETRMCRAYGARPLICRTYMSKDAGACERLVSGTSAPGTGVLGAQLLHMALLAVSRAVMVGTSMVHTYSLAEVARRAVSGDDIETTLNAARHGPKALADEIGRQRAVLSGRSGA